MTKPTRVDALTAVMMVERAARAHRHISPSVWESDLFNVLYHLRTIIEALTPEPNQHAGEDQAVISQNDARFIDTFLCSCLDLNPEWDEAYRAEVTGVWHRVMAALAEGSGK